MGGALRRPQFGLRKTVKFCIGVSIVPSSHLFPKSVMYRTREVRGDFDQNLTPGEHPATASLRSATPKENTPCFFDLRAENFLKWKGCFLSEFCPPSIRAMWRGYNAGSVLPNYFSGDLDLAKPRQNFPARRKGSGE